MKPINDASEFYGNSVVVDLLMPWLEYGSRLDRLSKSGYTYVALTVALDGVSAQDAIAAIARERRSSPTTGVQANDC